MRDSQPVSLESLLESGTRIIIPLKYSAACCRVANSTAPFWRCQMLKPHCRVANYRKQLLILEVSNTAQMARLRANFPHCRSALRGDFTIIIGHRHQNQSVIDKSSATGLPGGDKSSNSDSRGQKQRSGTN